MQAEPPLESDYLSFFSLHYRHGVNWEKRIRSIKFDADYDNLEKVITFGYARGSN